MATFTVACNSCRRRLAVCVVVGKVGVMWVIVKVLNYWVDNFRRRHNSYQKGGAPIK